MILEIHYTNREKQRIAGWKRTLPPNAIREFSYQIKSSRESGVKSEQTFDFIIESSDGHNLTLSREIKL